MSMLIIVTVVVQYLNSSLYFSLLWYSLAAAGSSWYGRQSAGGKARETWNGQLVI